jgi:hypothetical protein
MRGAPARLSLPARRPEPESLYGTVTGNRATVNGHRLRSSGLTCHTVTVPKSVSFFSLVDLSWQTTSHLQVDIGRTSWFWDSNSHTTHNCFETRSFTSSPSCAVSLDLPSPLPGVTKTKSAGPQVKSVNPGTLFRTKRRFLRSSGKTVS